MEFMNMNLGQIAGPEKEFVEKLEALCNQSGIRKNVVGLEKFIRSTVDVDPLYVIVKNYSDHSDPLFEVALRARKLQPKHISDAITFRNLRFVQYALDNKHLDYGMYGDWMFLHQACTTAHNHDMVAYLIKFITENKYNLDARNAYGYTALQIALEEYELLFPPTHIEPKTVLLLGPSQNGKSTFLKTIYSLQGQHLSISTGNGVRSCTVVTDKFKLWYTDRDYHIHHSKDKRKRVIETLNVVGKAKPLGDQRKVKNELNDASDYDILKFFNWDQSGELRIDENIYNSRKCEITLIDTPGLLDTNGNDEENAYNIVKFLNENRISKIDAVLFIVKFNTTCTEETKTVVQYYQRFLRDRMENFHIIFTHYDLDTRVTDIDAAMQHKEVSVRSELCEEFVKSCGLDSRVSVSMVDLIPNIPLRRRMKTHSMLADYFTESTLADIFRRILNSTVSLKLSSLSLPKPPRFTLIDKTISTTISTRKDGIVEGISRVNTELSKYIKRIEVLRGQISKLQNDLESKERTLTKLDTDDPEPFFKDVKRNDQWLFLRDHPPIVVKFNDMEFELLKVEINLIKSWNYRYLKANEDPEAYVGTRNFCATFYSGWFSGYHIETRFHTKSKFYNAKKIVELKKEVNKLREDIKKFEEMLVEEEKNEKFTDDEKLKIEEEQKLCEEVLKVTSGKEIELENFESMKLFYEEFEKFDKMDLKEVHDLLLTLKLI